MVWRGRKTILEILMSLTAFLGGVGGSIVNRLVDRTFGYFEKKQQIKIDALNNEHELKLLDKQHEYQMQAAQLNKDTIEMERELDLDLEELTSAKDIRLASYQHDNNAGRASQWVIDSIRMVRVVSTLFLVLIVAGMAFFSGLDVQQKIQIGALELANLAVGWWFGDAIQRNRD